MLLVDTHCHLQFPQYESVDKVLEAARRAEVAKTICVGTSLKDSRQAVELAKRHDGVWAAAGIHPHESAKFGFGSADTLKTLLTDPKVVAVGEIGLDYYRLHAGKADQLKAFRAQLDASLSSGLPYIFHVRDAWEDFWSVIDKYKIKRAVIHSFSARRAQLDQILSRGFFVGLNGIMTFTKDQEQLAAAKAVPLSRLVLETDAPFLTPVPYRGELCEPKHVKATAKFLAGLRGEPLEQLAAATTANAEELFGI